MSKINDLTANYILNKPKGLYLSSFKTINSKIVKKISNYNGPFPYIDGLIISLTSNISSIETQHDERKSGKSGYSLLKLLKLYGNMATNFSTVPLHICSLMGLFVGTLSGIYAVIIIIQKINALKVSFRPALKHYLFSTNSFLGHYNYVLLNSVLVD